MLTIVMYVDSMTGVQVVEADSFEFDEDRERFTFQVLRVLQEWRELDPASAIKQAKKLVTDDVAIKYDDVTGIAFALGRELP